MLERRVELVLEGGGVIFVRGIELDYSQSGEGRRCCSSTRPRPAVRPGVGD